MSPRNAASIRRRKGIDARARSILNIRVQPYFGVRWLDTAFFPFFFFLLHPAHRRTKKESGVEPPHSKVFSSNSRSETANEELTMRPGHFHEARRRCVHLRHL